MKQNERIVQVFEIKRQIDLAKVRTETVHPITGAVTSYIKFCSKADLSDEMKADYYRSIAGDCLNPFEQDAEAFNKLEIDNV